MSKLWYVGHGTGKYKASTKIPEARITTRFTTKAKSMFDAHGIHAVIVKVGGGMYQRAGLPDVYIQMDGKAVWIEMKRPGGDTTALQRATLLELQKAGAYVATCESVEEALAVLQEVISL
jgi:hypothetical protein